jgi:hypothetical protein
MLKIGTSAILFKWRINIRVWCCRWKYKLIEVCLVFYKLVDRAKFYQLQYKLFGLFTTNYYHLQFYSITIINFFIKIQIINNRSAGIWDIVSAPLNGTISHYIFWLVANISRLFFSFHFKLKAWKFRLTHFFD